MPAHRKVWPATSPVSLLIGTRKGAFMLRGNQSRRAWRLSGPLFLGHIIHHMVLDPRDGRTIVMAARTGHLGPTILRSDDRGMTWQEAKSPPAFPKAAPSERGLVVEHTFWLTPGHSREPGGLVCRLLSTGPVSVDPWWEYVGECRWIQPTPATIVVGAR